MEIMKQLFPLIQTSLIFWVKYALYMLLSHNYKEFLLIKRCKVFYNAGCH